MQYRLYLQHYLTTKLTDSHVFITYNTNNTDNITHTSSNYNAICQLFLDCLFVVTACLNIEILFLPREHKIHIFKLTCNVLFIIQTYWWWCFWWFSEDFQRFSKIVLKARWTFLNIFQEFPKISEDVRRFPKTFEEDPKMFWWYTN